MERWNELGDEAKNRMWAYCRTKAMMQGHESYEQERKLAMKKAK